MHDETINGLKSVPANSHSDLQNGSVQYGQRLLPTVIDQKAKSDPKSVWCSLPYDDNDLSKGYEDITYSTFANAINQIAWLIHDKFGPSQTFDTIVYMGRPDIRYQMVEVAVIKTGHKVLFSSHMNSLAGHLALIDQTGAKLMLSAPGVKVHDLLAVRPMRHEIISELDEILKGLPVKNYAYTKSFAEAKDDPFLILHTSGSTGAPKPVEYTLGSVSTLDHHQSLPETDPVSGYKVRRFFTGPGRPSRMLIPFLPFHCIVSTAGFSGMIFGGLIWIPGFRHKMVSVQDIPSILENCNAETAFLSPAMVEDLARRSDIGRYLSGLKKCLYGGASVTNLAGQVFFQFVHLQSQWGITETSKLIDIEPDPQDFGYCGFELEASGITFAPVTDHLYEMVVRRTPQSYPNVGIFWRCPDEEVFRPGDLWSPHPDLKKSKYIWKFEGRTDDLITWKDGTNFHPSNYESKHSEHEYVRSALMAGTGHRQPVLLLELYPDEANKLGKDEVVDQIWQDSIAQINKVAPTNGKVGKTHIVIASTDKPFERSVKGTVARKATIRRYEAEIEATYEQFGDKAVTQDERFGHE